MYVAQRWWRRLRENRDAGGTLMSGQERLAWGVAVGLVTSCSISIKWTGLATPGLIALESFFAVFFLTRSVDFIDLLKVAAVSATTYSTWFYIHFWLMPNSGDGDAFMRIEFQRTLKGNANYDPLAPRPSVFTTFQQLNREMLAANARIELRHNWESLWWEWPLNLRGLLYYSKDMPGAINRTKVRGRAGAPLLLGAPQPPPRLTNARIHSAARGSRRNG
jgi:dolichyl-phosphate-mannose--protein O-mannosyl transferase